MPGGPTTSKTNEKFKLVFNNKTKNSFWSDKHHKVTQLS